VVLQHYDRRLERREASVVEDLPLPTLDVDLEQVASAQIGERVAAFHASGTRLKQGRSGEERNLVRQVALELGKSGVLTSDPREVEAALEVQFALAGGRTCLDQAPRAVQAVRLDGAAQGRRVLGIRLQRDDPAPREQPEHEEGEVPHVAAEIDDAGRAVESL